MAKGKSRREALLIGAGLVAVAAGWQAWIRRPRAFDFQPIPGLTGWRRLPGGEISGGAGGDIFVGLDAGESVSPLEADRLCEVLFGRERRRAVPLAVFTDFNCPFCRRIAPTLAARASAGAIALHWLEWPVYGGRSEEVAHALVAAEEMGRADALRGPLYGGVPAPLSRVVAASGIPAAVLAERMHSPGVARRLQEIDRAAALLGLPGTPSMMVGRTLVIGAMSPEDLDRLIALEAEAGPPPCG
jgi:hypothetical protein